MFQYSKYISFAHLLCVALILPSCGTEVGNGHSGPAIDDFIKKSHEDRSDGSGNGGNPESQSPNASSPGSSQGAPADTVSDALAPYSMLGVLLNTCASPIANHTTT